MLNLLKKFRLEACTFTNVPADSAGSDVSLCRAEA